MKWPAASLPKRCKELATRVAAAPEGLGRQQRQQRQQEPVRERVVATLRQAERASQRESRWRTGVLKIPNRRKPGESKQRRAEVEEGSKHCVVEQP